MHFNMQHPTQNMKLSKVSQNFRCIQHTEIPRTLGCLNKTAFRNLTFTFQPQSMGNWDFNEIKLMDLHSMEDHIKKDYWINTHSNTNNCHVHEMQTWNDQLVKVVSAITLRQVIKSTVANMNTRQQQQTLQITIHMKKITQKPKFTSFKFQVSQTNCFTFPKTTKLQNFNSLQIPKTHANFSVHKLSSLFPVSHRLKPSYPI